MNVFCVSYDLNKSGQDYEGVINELKNSTSWWHYLGSTWLIATNESASTLSERIRKHTDTNDSLLVIRVTKDYAGWLTEEAWDWIKKHVTQTAQEPSSFNRRYF